MPWAVLLNCHLLLTNVPRETSLSIALQVAKGDGQMLGMVVNVMMQDLMAEPHKPQQRQVMVPHGGDKLTLQGAT